MLYITIFGFAQNEKSPLFDSCKQEIIDEQEACFLHTLKDKIETNFQLPEKVKTTNFKGIVRILFNVTTNGKFHIIYVNSPYKELETEIKRIFEKLPKVQPATYNARAIEKQYMFPLGIPIGYQPKNTVKTEVISYNSNDLEIQNQKNKENLVTILENNTLFPEHKSQLFIPFTHEMYDEFQLNMNNGNNAHTSVKPYLFSEVSSYVDLDAKKTALLKNTNSWFGKKLWNEHFFMVKGLEGKDKIPYWFTINPVLDLQLGKDANSDISYTFNNTRAVNVQGGIGSKFNFSASIYESQGRFADYINDYNVTNGIVLGRGKYKKFKENSFDYPVAEAYLSYSPNNIFNFQLGHGKNFIGDGYRSLFLSDVSSPYPFFKINTKFWKIKYTNLWMFLDDIRPEAQINGANLRKYVAIHYLSYNVNKRLNLGFFEAVVTNNSNNNGFDINYFNPLIFYRVVEFNRGSKAGNAMVGLNVNYKLTKNIFLYSQFLLDEMTIGELRNNSGYWANKFGIQAGFKYHNAFGVKNLYLQGETNIVRPYTYSHKRIDLNYGQFNQPLAHLWGSNFMEMVGIARFKSGRWFANSKFTFGTKGFDIDGDTASYGGNIYQSYDDRIGDYNNRISQGNKTNIFITELQAGYIINPATNLRAFSGIVYRNFYPELGGPEQNTWFSFGLKTDVFNWYSDF